MVTIRGRQSPWEPLSMRGTAPWWALTIWLRLERIRPLRCQHSAGAHAEVESVLALTGCLDAPVDDR